jgi:hypothetical protein
MRAAQSAKVISFPARLAHRHKTLGMLGSCISSLSVWSSLGPVFTAAPLLVAFFLPMGSFSHLGTALAFIEAVLMMSTAKHALDSLRWYARQNAEVWKMLFSIASVVLLMGGIVSISESGPYPFSRCSFFYPSGQTMLSAMECLYFSRGVHVQNSAFSLRCFDPQRLCYG